MTALKLKINLVAKLKYFFFIYSYIFVSVIVKYSIIKNKIAKSNLLVLEIFV